MNISVIIPSFQMGQFLPDALKSIARQSVPVQEIFVIDPGSTDDTKEVVATFLRAGLPIRYRHIDKGGPAIARNVGLREANGDIIAFLDADDLWPIDKLQKQCRKLVERPGIGVVSGLIRHFDVLDQTTLEPLVGSWMSTMVDVLVGACLYRRSVFDRLGLFDESLHYCEDNDLMNRVCESDVGLTIIKAFTLFYRKHAASMVQQHTPQSGADYSRTVQMSTARLAKLRITRSRLPLRHYINR